MLNITDIYIAADLLTKNDPIVIAPNEQDTRKLKSELRKNGIFGIKVHVSDYLPKDTVVFIDPQKIEFPKIRLESEPIKIENNRYVDRFWLPPLGMYFPSPPEPSQKQHLTKARVPLWKRIIMNRKLR
jgi:hypothetical protein